MTHEQAKALGATHYIQKKTRVQYWKNIGEKWWVYIGSAWLEAVKTIYRDYAIERIKPL